MKRNILTWWQRFEAENLAVESDAGAVRMARQFFYAGAAAGFHEGKRIMHMSCAEEASAHLADVRHEFEEFVRMLEREEP